MTTKSTATPRRVQRTRTAGQPGIPQGAVYVGRPSRWAVGPYATFLLLNPARLPGPPGSGCPDARPCRHTPA